MNTNPMKSPPVTPDAQEHVWYAASVGFEAARQVEILPADHRSHRLHGHSFLAKVRAQLPQGWAPFAGGETDALRDAIVEGISPLDYRYLNTVVPVPTDENLARWLRRRLQVPGLQTVGLQCTPDSGVDLDAGDRAHVWRRYRFESAHRLPHVPLGHKCGRVHGHGFEVLLHAEQAAAGSDLSIDYDFLDALWAPLQARLDRAFLNDILGLENPTSEMIARWIWRQLKPRLAALTWVTVYETASCGAQFDGQSFRIWKEMTLDSATRLGNAPSGDARRLVHGHTYTLRLHLHAPLDEVMGWTVDFGDVKEVFNPLFNRLDHNPLHEIAGMTDGDATSIARLIKTQCAELLPSLGRIDLYETRGCGVILSWTEAGPWLPV